jgi:hypothetical protein
MIPAHNACPVAPIIADEQYPARPPQIVATHLSHGTAIIAECNHPHAQNQRTRALGAQACLAHQKIIEPRAAEQSP